MTILASNCIICANEMSSDELKKVSSLKVNYSNFKVCESCLNRCDPTSDYAEAKKIVKSYLNLKIAKKLLKEASDIVIEIDS